MLSAHGIALADVKAIREVSWLQPVEEDFSGALAALEDQARLALLDQGVEADRITIEHRARLRMRGSDTTIELEVAEPEAMRAAFTALHRKRFGYFEEGSAVIVDSLIAEAVGHYRGGACPASCGASRKLDRPGADPRHRLDDRGRAGLARDPRRPTGRCS